MRRLLLFNPETEYALASGASFYTPPARVEKVRHEGQLLPEAWAESDDFILVDDPSMLTSRFNLVGWHELRALFERYPDLSIEPWGWNPALIKRFIDNGVPSHKLPDSEQIARIRSLAHRRTTILLNSLWNERVDKTLNVDIPRELSTIDACMEFYLSNPGCWLKAPWSSSGRGVINTAADMTYVLVEQWCRGILRRQGAVLGETGADRVADFATEWQLTDGKATCLGLSSFSTSNRGKYISNEFISQQDMALRFNAVASMPIETVILLQKDILQKVLSGYEGLFGVDMLVERDGSVRPFVELNLRRTMGMLFCSSQRR